VIIERHNAQQYTLSIRVSADGFCFAVHHPQRADEYAFQPYAPDPLLPVVANLRQAREALPMLQHHYACVQLLLADAPYEVIPAPFAGAETADDAPALMDDGGRTPVTIRFAPDSSLSAWVRATWPDARIVPGIWPVVRFALRFGLGVRGERLGLEAATYTPNPSPLTPHPITLCHLHGRSMDVVSIRDGRLQFVNTFDVPTAVTALYYLMGTWQTLGLSQTDDELAIVGRSPIERELKAKATRFIHHVREPRSADLFHTTELARLSAVPFDLQALVGFS